jgi:hypothetical protein
MDISFVVLLYVLFVADARWGDSCWTERPSLQRNVGEVNKSKAAEMNLHRFRSQPGYSAVFQLKTAE